MNCFTYFDIDIPVISVAIITLCKTQSGACGGAVG
jgi:hypothetical protein